MWEKIYHANTAEKLAEMPIVLSHKIDFRARNISREIKRFTLYDKEVNSLKIHKNSKDVCTWS